MKDPIQGGYIYLAKSLLESDLWFCSSNTIKVGIYLLLSANFADDERKHIKRGECWKTLGIISEDCNITVKAVRCALDRLKSIDFIQSRGAYRGARSGQCITICNYSKFQDIDNYRGAGQGHQKGHKKGQAKGQHYNESNEENEEDIYRAFDHLSITVTEFERLVGEGYTKEKIDDILDSIENFAANKKYKSLVLTARNWLKSDKKKTDAQIDELNLDSPEWDTP